MKIGDLVLLSETACLYGCHDLDNPVYGVIVDILEVEFSPDPVYDVYTSQDMINDGNFYYGSDLTVINSLYKESDRAPGRALTRKEF